MDISEYQMFANAFGYIFHHNCICEGSRIVLLTLPWPQLAGVRIRLLFWILLKFKQALACSTCKKCREHKFWSSMMLMSKVITKSPWVSCNFFTGGHTARLPQMLKSLSWWRDCISWKWPFFVLPRLSLLSRYGLELMHSQVWVGSIRENQKTIPVDFFCELEELSLSGSEWLEK